MSLRKNLYNALCLVGLLLFTTAPGIAQTKKALPSATELHKIQKQYGLNPNSSLLSRVGTTPDDALKIFRDAGMSPTEHQLTKEETLIVSKAFATLPPLHQRVLKQHLKSISFLDNMPNTALTSPVTKDEGVKLYHIAFRAGILRQTISEWATWKERTCFTGGDSSITISVQAGLLSALTYVMLHEGTHVVDGALQVISADTVNGKPKPNPFTINFANGVWKNINTNNFLPKDSIVLKSIFKRGGRRFAPTEAAKVYAGLSQAPFVSLYSTASWHEDLAELLTVYHLTQKLRQPFGFVVMQNGKQVYTYEPMNNAWVKKRARLLQRFYAKT